MIKKTDIVYISGPMTGYHLYNYPLFFAVEGLLKKYFACKVLNPARHEDGLEYEKYMKRAMLDVQLCDCIVLLPGWLSSRGASREVAEGQRLQKRFLLYDEILTAISIKLEA